MSPDEMLTQLQQYGDDAGQTLNDGDLMGWFGWSINDDIITVSFEPTDDENEIYARESASWRLVPLNTTEEIRNA